MKVSLITACYNSSTTIRTAIESVLSQKGVDLEYIVVDGGSKDGTVDIIEEYSTCSTRSTRFKYISEPDEGMYDAINKGIKMATGDVVGILNADDMFESQDTLAHVVEAFRSGGVGERVDCVYADIRFVKEDLQTTSRYYSAKHWKPWMLQWGKMPPHPSVYIRRELFDKYGLYKLGYDIAADYELLIRYLRMAKLNTRYLNECLVKMRMGGKSTRGWKSFITLNKEIVRGNLENGYFCCFPMLLPKYLFKIFEFILPRLGFK
ncbi:MAG: glycosyltransferase [Kiritimatiellae bacterium]|nr:glycosyltransferase [Kiritimatiellia bacterium]